MVQSVTMEMSSPIVYRSLHVQNMTVKWPDPVVYPRKKTYAEFRRGNGGLLLFREEQLGVLLKEASSGKTQR